MYTASVSKTHIHIVTYIIYNFYELLYRTIRISVGKKFANNISWQWAIKSHRVQKRKQRYRLYFIYNHSLTVYVVYIIEWMIAKLKGILLLNNFQSTAHNSYWSLLTISIFFISLSTSCRYFTAISHRKTSKELIFYFIYWF